MSVLVLDEAAREKIELAVGQARARPLPLAEVERIAKEVAQSNMRTLKDAKVRKPVPVELGDYTAYISFEYQPPGLCRHLSVSARRKGTVPHPAVFAQIAHEFGFESFPHDRDEFRMWAEEFEPGHHAVNLLEVVTPGTSGTA